MGNTNVKESVISDSIYTFSQVFIEAMPFTQTLVPLLPSCPFVPPWPLSWSGVSAMEALSPFLVALQIK